MNKKLGQESAFPEIYKNNDGSVDYTPGMNKRFYAACVAMQGLCANTVYFGEGNQENIMESIITDSYRLADELLKQENNE